MDSDFEIMNKRITEYFSRVSDDQLRVDLERAGYSFYKKVKTPVIDSFLPEDEFIAVRTSKHRINMDVGNLVFQEFSVADSYDNYGYKLAA